MTIPTPASDRARQLGLDNREVEEGAKYSAEHLSRWPDDLPEAEQAIRRMGSEAIPFLLQVIEEQRRVYRRRRPVKMVCWMAGTSLILLSQTLRLADLVLFSPLWILWMTVTILLGVEVLQNATFLQGRAGALLSRIATKEQIGVLIELLPCTEGNNLDRVRAALVRILPQLQASDAACLTKGHRKILARELGQIPGDTDIAYRDYLIALLQSLKQVGDGSFVAPVRLLYQAEASAIGPRLHAAARDCLPYLEAFAEQEQKSGRLVRPASAPDGEQSTTLLRPAGTTRQSDEHALLVRSVEDGE